METTILIVDSEYKDEDSVELQVVRSVPQPNKIEKENLTVKDVKKKVEDLEMQIVKLSEEKAYWENILQENKVEIKNSVKK